MAEKTGAPAGWRAVLRKTLGAPYRKQADRAGGALDELLTQTVKSVTIGGDGGKEWEDTASIRQSGPITSLKVRHGKEIDGIEVSYGGTPGLPHGGRGGQESQFTAPPGYDIVQIQTRSGRRVNSLRFVAKPQNGEGDAVSSEIFGGDGGHSQIIDSPEGLPLRSIEGRAGSKIDALTFNFGYLYSIENIQVDKEALRAQVAGADLVALDSISYANETEIDTSAQFARKTALAVTNTAHWESSSRFLAGYEITVSAGVEGMVSVETAVKFEFEQTFIHGKEQSVTSTVEKEWDVVIPIPKMKLTTAFVSIYEADVQDVPFTYDVVFYEVIDQVKVEQKRVKQSATFSGLVTASEVDVSVKSEDLPPGHLQKIIDQFR